MARRHWLFKSEPDVYGFAHLLAEPDRTTLWDGVRNYQARNLLRDEVQVGDLVLFYHSQSDPPHVAGVCEVVRAGYPDPTQFDPASKYHDEKATPAAPRWFVVDVRAVAPLTRPVALAELKADPRLEGLLVIRKGQRLSVMPVEAAHHDVIVSLGGGLSGAERPN